MKKSNLIGIFLIITFLGAQIAIAREKEHVRVLATGAKLHCPASVRFAPNGDMWVVDGFSNKFYRMSPRTGWVLETIDGADGSAAVEVDEDGNIYWASSFIGEIFKRTPDGTVTILAELNSNCDGLELGPNGTLYVSTLFVENALWEISTDGFEPQPRKVLDIGGLDAFAFGPDGYLYAPNWLAGTGEILRIDVDSGEAEVFTNGFASPSALRFSPDGEMHVFDFAKNQIIKVDMDTKEKSLAAQLVPGCDDFAFSPEGEIYFANMQDGFVGKVLQNGMNIYLTRPGLSNPGGITVRTNDRGQEVLWVGDGWTVRRYNGRSGHLQKTYYTTMADPDDIFGPFSLYDDGTDLILTNALFNLVQKWDPITETTKGLWPDFAVPVNAATFQGELIVAELMTGEVVRESDRTPLISNLVVPAGLAINEGDLWVSDWATGMIWKAVEDGEVLSPPEVVVEGLVNPEGMTIDHDSNLLVVETGKKRLIKVDLEDGGISVIADGLAVGLPADGGGPPTWVALSSVAVSDRCDIYLTGDVGNVIYKIMRRGRNCPSS